MFLLSDSFTNKHDSFITVGNYSTNPSEHLKSGYTYDFNDNMYSVIKSTMKETIFNNDSGNFKGWNISFINYFNSSNIIIF